MIDVYDVSVCWLCGHEVRAMQSCSRNQSNYLNARKVALACADAILAETEVS